MGAIANIWFKKESLQAMIQEIENSEKKIKEKCMYKYKKKYFELKAISHKNVNFELKNKYIEDQIEKNF